MRVAILDDGVNEGWLKEKGIINLQVNEENQIVKRVNYDKYEKNHGTLCAAIIKKYAPNCEIISIKVLNKNRHGTCSSLLRALDWCRDNNISLIHMSIGSTKYIDYEPLRKKTAQLISNNSIIVGACHNGNKYTVPACLSCVIGVKALEESCDEEYLYNREYLDDADIMAQARHYVNGEWTPIANSYAAPYITAKVYNLIKDNQLSLAEVKQSLYNTLYKANDIKKELTINLAYCMDFIYRAYVIDYGQKLQYQLCEFDIERINLDELSTAKVSIGASIIIVANSDINDKAVISFLENNKKNIIGIAVCGQVSEKLKSFLLDKKTYLLWSSDMPHKGKGHQSTEIPIVSVRCMDKSSQTVIGKRIAKRFQEHSYGVLMVSDEVCSPLYGYKYFKSEQLTDGLLNQYINKVEPDIVIAGLDNKNNIYSDIQLYCNNVENKLYDIYDGEKVIELNCYEDSIVEVISSYLS